MSQFIYLLFETINYIAAIIIDCICELIYCDTLYDFVQIILQGSNNSEQSGSREEIEFNLTRKRNYDACNSKKPMWLSKTESNSTRTLETQGANNSEQPKKDVGSLSVTKPVETDNSEQLVGRKKTKFNSPTRNNFGCTTGAPTDGEAGMSLVVSVLIVN